MMRAFAPLWTDPALRLAAGMMLLWGAITCGMGPYISVLAVREFGLGDAGYAVLMVVSTALSVAVSVGAGIRADQRNDRRGITRWAVGALMVALGLMTVLPGRVSFIAAQGVLMPVASILFGQLFALARMAASTHSDAARDAIMAAIRALFALPFVAVLPLWALAFANGVPLLSIYPVGLIMALPMTWLVLRHWPKDGQTRWQDAPSGLSFRDALAELTAPRVALRLVALGAVNCSMTVSLAILSLILVPEIGRGAADVALYAGIVAGLEVPFMLAVPALARRMDRTRLILWGTLVHGLSVATLPWLAPTPWLWALMLPAGAGGAVMLTIPIAYLQDLMADRPGTGSSLMSLQFLIASALGALCFALGTAIAGYGLAALLGVGVSLVGAVVLVLADRKS
jgi:MFS transporter, SET family, sugar efflux transporter